MIQFTFRVERPSQSAVFHLKANGKDIFQKKLPWVNPANMVEIKVELSDSLLKSVDHLEASLDG